MARPAPHPAHRPVWPAYVIALGALFISLGGPSHAATLITGDDVKNGSLTGFDVKDGSLKAIDVKDGSLGLADLADADEAALDGTSGACPADHVLQWVPVMVTGNGVAADVEPTFRLARCALDNGGVPIAGDGVVQVGEECDDGNVVSGDGCSIEGQLASPRGLDFFYTFGPE